MLVNQPAILSGAFAAEGDKNTIPANNDGLSGLASIAKGFPPITQVPLAQGGLPPQRQDFNGIFNLFSQFLLYAQNGGVYAYNNTLDYQPPCLVADPDSNIIYQCLQQNGPNTSAGVQALTQTAYWKQYVPNYASQSDAEAGTDNTKIMTPLRVNQAKAEGTVLNDDAVFQATTNAGRIVLYGGTQRSQGACLLLFGEDASSYAGDFVLEAANDAQSCNLYGNSDGVLTWNSKTVLTCDYSYNAGNAQQTALKYADGTLIIIGSATTNISADVNVTYVIPFVATPYTFTGTKMLEGALLNWYSGTSAETNTSVQLKGSVTGQALIIAFLSIGRWK